MSVGIPSRRPQFDNLSYVSDGRDRISYIRDPYAAPPRPVPADGQSIVLQPGDLRHAQGHDNTIYTYRSGQDNLHAYNNAAFSDISGADSRGPSIRSQHANLYAFQKPVRKPTHHGKVFRICSKYWYLFALAALIVLIAIGLAIGFTVARSKNKTAECHLTCPATEKLVQLNSTYCECQLVDECDSGNHVLGQDSCKKSNETGCVCKCSTGFQHSPITHDLTACQDINECANASACGPYQICNNTVGSYRCSCQSGYETITTINGITCQDKNECIDRNSCTNGQCINTNGSFLCKCNAGFTQDIFNQYHCEDVNECLSTHNCTGNNEICQNTMGSFQCVCARGYRRDQNQRCINIDECAQSTVTCDIHSRCEDRNGSFACCADWIASKCVECGYDYSNPRVRRRRMINGQVVEPGDFPWSAAVLIKQAYYSSEPRYVCSATLVSSWNVITAAHCLDEDHFRKQWDLTSEPSSFKDIFDIRIGVHDLASNSTDFLSSHSYSIANFTLHPNYKPLTSDDVLVKNDIALIRLSKRIERAPILDWICLPTAVKVQDQSILKVVAYSNAEEHSVQQQLDVRVLDHPRTRSECQRQLTDIAEDAFCAISTRNSSSLGVGDSGAGAMLYKDATQWHLAGVMSKTGLQKAYSAMTNVTVHMDWLQSLVER